MDIVLKIFIDETLWKFMDIFSPKWPIFEHFRTGFRRKSQAFDETNTFWSKSRSHFLSQNVILRHDVLIAHIITSIVLLSSLAIVLSSLGMICYHHRHDIWAGQRVWVTRLRKCSPDESKCSFEACFEGVMMIQLIVLSSLALPIDYHGRGRWNLGTFGAPRPAGPF